MPDVSIQEHEIEDFINDLVSSIQDGVVPELHVGYENDYGPAADDDIVIPSDDLKDAIREVMDRWIDEGLAST